MCEEGDIRGSFSVGVEPAKGELVSSREFNETWLIEIRIEVFPREEVPIPRDSFEDIIECCIACLNLESCFIEDDFIIKMRLHQFLDDTRCF